MCFDRHRIRLSTRSILLLNHCENQTHILDVVILLTDCVILNCALTVLHLQLFTHDKGHHIKPLMHFPPNVYLIGDYYYLAYLCSFHNFSLHKNKCLRVYTYTGLLNVLTYSNTCSLTAINSL